MCSCIVMPKLLGYQGISCMSACIIELEKDKYFIIYKNAHALFTDIYNT